MRSAEIEERRSASIELKLPQLSAQMASVGPLGWEEGLARGEADVRERWLTLKQSYRRGLDRISLRLLPFETEVTEPPYYQGAAILQCRASRP